MSQAVTRTPVRPFVGRAGELESLHDALAEAGAGRGALVLITGEPGIGKIRSMHEFANVAAVVVAAIGWTNARGKTFEIYNEPGAPPTD